MLRRGSSSSRLGCYRARGELRPLMGRAPQRHGAGRRGPKAMAWVGQGVDALELAIDGLREGEWVEAVALTLQLGRDLGTELGAGEQAVQRRARAIIAAAHACTDPLLAQQFDRGQEEVLKRPQVVPV